MYIFFSQHSGVTTQSALFLAWVATLGTRNTERALVNLRDVTQYIAYRRFQPIYCLYYLCLQGNTNTLENVQKFAFRMCSKHWDQVYSQLLQLFDITKLSERRLYLDLCTMFKIVHGLFHFSSGIFNTYSGRTPSTNRPFCFIDPSLALTTSITRLSLVQSLYGTHYHSHLCLIVTYHILDHMYGCILHITSAILCILCYSA